VCKCLHDDEVNHITLCRADVISHVVRRVPHVPSTLSVTGQRLAVLCVRRGSSFNRQLKSHLQFQHYVASVTTLCHVSSLHYTATYLLVGSSYPQILSSEASFCL